MSGLFKKRLDDSAESRMEHPASKSWIFFTFLLAFVLCIVFGEIFWAPIWNRTWPAVTCLRHALLPDIRLIAPFT